MLSPRHYAAPMTDRCFGSGDPLYEAYHDDEWGLPVTGDIPLFERFSLEAFQSGLSWITVLRKRENFRTAFAGFDPSVVARFGGDDVARLLADAGIIRNRLKIDAVIANARVLADLQEQSRSLTELVWSFVPAQHRRPASFGELAAHTAESAALAKALKKEGFRFIGPTTAYAAMQSCGLVNDHIAGCEAGDRVDELAL